MLLSVGVRGAVRAVGCARRDCPGRGPARSTAADGQLSVVPPDQRQHAQEQGGGGGERYERPMQRQRQVQR